MPPKARVSEEQLVQLMARMGPEVARGLLHKVRTDLGIGGGADFDRETALAILDHLANTTGLASVVARFAKARLILM